MESPKAPRHKKQVAEPDAGKGGDGAEGKACSNPNAPKPPLLLPVPLRTVNAGPLAGLPPAPEAGPITGGYCNQPGEMAEKRPKRMLQGRTPMVQGNGFAAAMPPQHLLGMGFSASPKQAQQLGAPAGMGFAGVSVAPSPMSCGGPNTKPGTPMVCDSPAAAFLTTHSHLPRDMRRQLAEWNKKMEMKENQAVPAGSLPPPGGSTPIRAHDPSTSVGFFGGPAPMEWEPTPGSLAPPAFASSWGPNPWAGGLMNHHGAAAPMFGMHPQPQALGPLPATPLGNRPAGFRFRP